MWEFKSTTREDATIHDAYTQITTRYTRDIPELFKYNAFVVISDGINSKMGSVFSDYEHFYAWRKVNDTDKEEDGLVTVRQDRVQEMILYLADVEDWLERKGMM